MLVWSVRLARIALTALCSTISSVSSSASLCLRRLFGRADDFVLRALCGRPTRLSRDAQEVPGGAQQECSRTAQRCGTPPQRAITHSTTALPCRAVQVTKDLRSMAVRPTVQPPQPYLFQSTQQCNDASRQRPQTRAHMLTHKSTRESTGAAAMEDGNHKDKLVRTHPSISSFVSLCARPNLFLGVVPCRRRRSSYRVLLPLCPCAAV